jgi:hypothetical protein
MMEKKDIPLSTKTNMIISCIVLLTLLIGFNQCVYKPNGKMNQRSTLKYGTTTIPSPGKGDASDIGTTTKLPAGLDMPPMNTPVVESEMSTLEVGVKNFEQINMTMSALTGVPTNEAAIVTTFNDITTQLPSDNNVKNFLPSMQVAITKLATEYCDRLVETDAYRKVIWTTVNFAQGPTQTLTTVNKTQLISETVERFLGPIDASTANSSKAELANLLETLISGENLTSSLTTKKAVKGVCVASLSSAYVTLL